MGIIEIGTFVGIVIAIFLGTGIPITLYYKNKIDDLKRDCEKESGRNELKNIRCKVYNEYLDVAEKAQDKIVNMLVNFMNSGGKIEGFLSFSNDIMNVYKVIYNNKIKLNASPQIYLIIKEITNVYENIMVLNQKDIENYQKKMKHQEEQFSKINKLVQENTNNSIRESINIAALIKIDVFNPSEKIVELGKVLNELFNKLIIQMRKEIHGIE